MKWYAVATFSGYEARAKTLLEENIKTAGLGSLFGDDSVDLNARYGWPDALGHGEPSWVDLVVQAAVSTGPDRWDDLESSRGGKDALLEYAGTLGMQQLGDRGEKLLGLLL